MEPEKVISPAENAVFIPTIIAQSAIGRLPSYMNLAKTVARDFELTPAKIGSSIQVGIRGALVANDKVKGLPYNLQDPTATEVTVHLNKHKEVSFLVEDITKVMENQDTAGGYGEDAAIAIAEAVEEELAKLYSSISADPIAFDATSLATKKASLLAVRKFFVDNKVPKIEPRFIYGDGTLTGELLEEDSFTSAAVVGKAVIADGALTNIYGMQIFESQNVQSSGSPVEYHNICYTKNAIVLATRPLMGVPAGLGAVSSVINDPNTNIGIRVVAFYDGKLGGIQVNLDVLFGCAVLDQRRIVELTSN